MIVYVEGINTKDGMDGQWPQLTRSNRRTFANLEHRYWQNYVLMCLWWWWCGSLVDWWPKRKRGHQSVSQMFYSGINGNIHIKKCSVLITAIQIQTCIETIWPYLFILVFVFIQRLVTITRSKLESIIYPITDPRSS